MNSGSRIVPQLLRALATIAGTTLAALAPYYAGQRWFDIVIAIASGAGIYVVHNPPGNKQREVASNGDAPGV